MWNENKKLKTIEMKKQHGKHEYQWHKTFGKFLFQLFLISPDADELHSLQSFYIIIMLYKYGDMSENKERM